MTPPMTGLVAWLREQIAEIEQVAHAARPGPWLNGTDRPDLLDTTVYGQSSGPDKLEDVCDTDDSDEFATANCDHISLHDPRAVLDECEAHTAIVDRCVEEVDAWTIGVNESGPEVADFTLRALALAYQHRPGFREEWRPE